MPSSVAELCQIHDVPFHDLVDRSGLEAGRVQAIVMGRWTPSPSERQAIAAVFRVEVAEIAWGHKTPIQHIYGF